MYAQTRDINSSTSFSVPYWAEIAKGEIAVKTYFVLCISTDFSSKHIDWESVVHVDTSIGKKIRIWIHKKCQDLFIYFSPMGNKNETFQNCSWQSLREGPIPKQSIAQWLEPSSRMWGTQHQVSALNQAGNAPEPLPLLPLNNTTQRLGYSGIGLSLSHAVFPVANVLSHIAVAWTWRMSNRIRTFICIKIKANIVIENVMYLVGNQLYNTHLGIWALNICTSREFGSFS